MSCTCRTCWGPCSRWWWPRCATIKDFSFFFSENVFHCGHPAPSKKGRCARSSRHAGRGAMAVRCRSVGRGLARTNGRLADVKAYGPGAPMLAPSPRVMIPPATVAKSRTPGRLRSKRENHRAGKAGRSRLHLWYLPPAFFLAGGPQASAGAWPSLRPLHERVKRSARLGRIRAARRRLHVRVTVNGSKLQRMIARWTVTHRRALKTMTRFLRTRATLRARPSWNANPEHGRQAGVGAYPRRFGLQTGNTVTAIRRALDASMVRRGETAIARNQLNAG